MDFCVITPTRLLGGLDVNFASLAHQTGLDGRLMWVIVDEWFEQRHDEVHEVMRGLDLGAVTEVRHLPGPPKREGMWNNLASCYNLGLRAAREDGYQVVVSMQDYFWLPADCLKLLAEDFESYPHSLVTVFASLTGDPPPEKAVNLDGGWSVYAEPFDYVRDRPTVIRWPDCRMEGGNGELTEVFPIRPMGWELNVAAIGPGVVGTPLEFDIEYERGVAFDNQDFALRAAVQYDADIILDPRIHTLGLPHKAYFPGIEQREFAESNMQWHLERHAEFIGKGL